MDLMFRWSISLLLLFAACVHAEDRCTKPDVGLKIHYGGAYPYERPFSEPPNSFLFVNGKAYRYLDLGQGVDDALTTAQINVDGRSVSVERFLDNQPGIDPGKIATMEHREPVLAYGSNPALTALNNKYCAEWQAKPVVIPVIEAELQDYDVVHAAHLVGNGMPPATMMHSPGTRVQVYVQYLTPDDIEVLDRSEGVGVYYARQELRGAELALENGAEMKSVNVYWDCFGPLSIDDEHYAYDRIPAAGRSSESVTPSEMMGLLMLELDFEGSPNCFLAQNVMGKQCRANRISRLMVSAKPDALPHARAIPGKSCGNLDQPVYLEGACGICPQ